MNSLRDKVLQKLNSTSDFIKHNYWPLFIFSTPVLIMIEVLDTFLLKVYWDNEGFLLLVTSLVGIILKGLMGVMLIFIIYNIHNQRKFTLDDMIQFILRNIIFVSAALFIINAASRIGFIFLIAPGIYILSRLAVTPFLICLNRVPFGNAFRLSWEYSNKEIRIIFISISIIAFPAFMLTFLSYFIETQLILSVISFLIGVNTIIGYVLVFYFYLDIESHMVGFLKINGE